MPHRTRFSACGTITVSYESSCQCGKRHPRTTVDLPRPLSRPNAGRGKDCGVRHTPNRRGKRGTRPRLSLCRLCRRTRNRLTGAPAAAPGSGPPGATLAGGNHSACRAAYSQAPRKREKHRGGGLGQGRSGKVHDGGESGAGLGRPRRQGRLAGRRYLRAEPPPDDGPRGRKAAEYRWQAFDPLARTRRRSDVHRIHDRSGTAHGVARTDGDPGADSALGRYDLGRSGLPRRRHAARYRRHTADPGSASPGQRRRHRHHAPGHCPAGCTQGPQDVRKGRGSGARCGGEHERARLQPVRSHRARVRQRRRCPDGGPIRRATAGRAAAGYPHPRGCGRRFTHGNLRARQRPRPGLPSDGAPHGSAVVHLEQRLQPGIPQDHGRSNLMSIKSDRWIRRMAREHGMIEPFAPEQVRMSDGHKIVSYGTSSYGYDVRCTDEFKIFTNINSTIVDPKNFDEKSFVDFKGPVCIIPPNSFALASTVEFFRIPRKVLVACLGKSTYARCFRGDTRVALVDGTAPTLEEMAKRHDSGELFWGYSIGQNGRLIVSLLDAPRFVGRDSLLEVDLDNGERIHATPDHLFMRRDGRMTAAHALRPRDALMPLYRDVIRGYESVYQPIDGYLNSTHHLADEWNIRHNIYAEARGTHRHHLDFDRRNNRPTNIIRMEASQHIRLHNADNYGEDFDPGEHGSAISAALTRRAADPQWREHFSRVQSRRAKEFRQADRYEQIRSRVIDARRNPTDATREAHRQAMLRRFSNPSKRARYSRLTIEAWASDDGTRRSHQAEIARRIRLRAEITEDTVRRALDHTGSIRGAAALLDCDRSVFRRFPEVVAEFGGTPAYRNHKVVAVREIAGDHDVYCLTVPEAGNFALEGGVFVQNCGIIVNVTPLEPEWEGHVTLEFSNTTPLPAKIYANEGVAQMLFFESDEVCETSYADRGGKYQGQRGVTLPKT